MLIQQRVENPFSGSIGEMVNDAGCAPGQDEDVCPPRVLAEAARFSQREKSEFDRKRLRKEGTNRAIAIVSSQNKVNNEGRRFGSFHRLLQPPVARILIIY